MGRGTGQWFRVAIGAPFFEPISSQSVEAVPRAVFCKRLRPCGDVSCLTGAVDPVRSHGRCSAGLGLAHLFPGCGSLHVSTDGQRVKHLSRADFPLIS